MLSARVPEIITHGYVMNCITLVGDFYKNGKDGTTVYGQADATVLIFFFLIFRDVAAFLAT